MNCPCFYVLLTHSRCDSFRIFRLLLGILVWVPFVTPSSEIDSIHAYAESITTNFPSMMVPIPLTHMLRRLGRLFQHAILQKDPYYHNLVGRTYTIL